MENIESLRERIEVLEHHTTAMIRRAHLIERRLRWWRVLACGSLVVGVISLPLPSGTAQDESSEYSGIRKRLAALEYKLQYVSGGPNEIVISGANLRIVNGLGDTETTNGLGNLIVGYNESRQEFPACTPTIPGCIDTRTGSHNVVVGRFDNFSSFGGLLAGEFNEISGEFASVTGGTRNTASGIFSLVSGGQINSATGILSSIIGGQGNTASGTRSWMGGGSNNTASGDTSSIIGGEQNTASGGESVVSAGQANIASGEQSAVRGGEHNTASGTGSADSGGTHNPATGDRSSVSGGDQH